MKTKYPRKKIEVTGHYRKDYHCTLYAIFVNNEYYISKCQALKAERECRLPTGDNLVKCGGGLLWIE